MKRRTAKRVATTWILLVVVSLSSLYLWSWMHYPGATAALTLVVFIGCCVALLFIVTRWAIETLDKDDVNND